jgi:hypothetical protein
MKIITDSFFNIGSTHLVCEDYAMSGSFKNIESNPLSYAIVSDGCSSSDNVDLGARLLTHAARYEIENFYRCKDFYQNSSVEYRHKIVGDAIVKRASNCLDVLGGVLKSSLDATLIYVVSDGEKTFVNAYGDGNIVIKTRDYIEVINISFETGAPYYLSYLLNDSRRYEYERFTKEGEAKKKIHKSIYDNDGGLIAETFDSVEYDHPFCIAVDNSVISVSLFSDGIETYRYFCEDANCKRTHGLQYISEELVGFKNFGEDFAKRRIKSFHKRGRETSLEHEDDVSVGAIVFKDNLGI